jgi:hypothetical protein
MLSGEAYAQDSSGEGTMSPEAAAWNAESAAAWEARTADLPFAPSLHPTACPTCRVDGPLGGTGVLPARASWELYSGYRRDQRGTGLCALFGDLALVEVQYVINNCEQLTPRPDGCPVRPWDDDPGLVETRLVQGTLAGRDTWELDLSEQLVVSCGEHGYRHVGAGSLDHERFLGEVGTVVERLAPYRLEYVFYEPFDPVDPTGPEGHDQSHWWPPRHARPGDVDRFYGTCPLVHRFGAGDGTLPFGGTPGPRDARWIEIAAVAAAHAPPIAGGAALVRTAWDPAREDHHAWHQVAEEDLLGYLAAGYVVADTMAPAWTNAGPGAWRCLPGACTEGGDCGGHVVLLLGYEDGGETLIVRNSHGESGPVRIRRGTCGVGVGGMRTLFLGDPRDPPTLRPSITSHPVLLEHGSTDPNLRIWLDADADGDGIRNGWDVCLYSPNPGLVVPTSGSPFPDPRVTLPGHALDDPLFLDDDAWPDDHPADLGDDEWNPAWGFRRGCDDCPGFPTADRYADDDGDWWAEPCDGCPGTPQPLYSQMNANRPTYANDPDFDWIADACDYCPAKTNRGEGNLDPDENGLGLACDPCPRWWDLPPTHPAYRPYIRDERCSVLPADGDVDHDGIRNDCDNCCLEPNPLQEDGAWDWNRRADGIGNACELCPGVDDEGPYDPADPWLNDVDRDRVGDFCLGRRHDNCPGEPNPFQLDWDDDGYGNPCDMCPGDPRWATGERDSDGDGLADVCDPCPYGQLADPRVPSDLDWDGDGWPDVCDNCPNVMNPGQQNCDWRWEAHHWGVSGLEVKGDACDADPCTGAPPIPADVLLNPRARPGSEDDVSPIVSSWLDIPPPAVPAPTPSWRPVLQVGPFHSESATGETMTVTVPTTGTRFRQMCGIVDGVERCFPPVSTPESLPVMLRRCVCWNYVTNEAITDPAVCVDPLNDFCPNNGQVNFKWREQEDLPHGPPQQLSGWLAAKAGPGLNLPRDGVAIEDVSHWNTLEQPVPQDHDLTTPPAGPHSYAAEGGFWFDLRRRYEAGRSYPGWSVWWHWQEEALPRGMDEDGDGVPDGGGDDGMADRRVPFVLWTRPHVVLDNPAAGVFGTRMTDGTLAQHQWPLVAKFDARCAPGHPDGIDCNDFDNAYSPDILWAQEIRTSVTTGERPIDPGDRYAPFGDWGDPPDARGMPTIDRVVMAIVRIVNPGDPADLKFASYEPSAKTQGLLVNPVRLGTGYADPMGFPTRMAPGQPAIDVSEFSVAFEAAPWANRLPRPALFATAPPVMPEGRYYLFGGLDSSGAPSSKLWVGETQASTSTEPPVVEWRRAGAQGPQPPALRGAALFVHLDGKPSRPVDDPPTPPPGDWAEVDNDLLVLGGVTAAGTLNANLWWYDAETNMWRGSAPEPGDWYAGAWPAATWHGGDGYLYGGWDGSAPVDGLFRVDLATRRLRRLDAPASPSPGPRGSASIAVTGDGEALYLYGGYSTEGWLNDVWRFDFRTGAWTEAAPVCSWGQCPAVGAAALSVESSTGRVFLVPTAADAQNQPWWLLDGGR